MCDYINLFNEINVERKNFENIIEEIKNEKNLSYKELLAYKALKIATHCSTGYFSSETLENVFLEIAQKNKIQLADKAIQNTFLHVMSEAYSIGGHTRVVERWIEHSSPEQKHSVLLTRECRKSLPIDLDKAVKCKHGDVTILSDKLNNTEKGLQLRAIASEYEYVILHIHMDDVIPLIAFGTEDFKRPVLLFNHADHRFWVGGSIADCVIDFRKWGKEITLNRRGLENSSILSIPNISKKQKIYTDKEEIRKELGLPLDKKIIITIGNAKKYKPFRWFNFYSTIEKILLKNKDFLFIAIGPNYKTLPEWKKGRKKYKKRFEVLGDMSHEEIFKYLGCADIVLDSFPMSGGTALMDAVSARIPVLSMKCPTGQLDYIVDSSAYCLNEKMLLNKVYLLLNDNKKCDEHVKEISLKLDDENRLDLWRKKLECIYAQNNTHSLHKIKCPIESRYTDLDLYLAEDCINRKIKFDIPNVLRLERYKRVDKKIYYLILLNKVIFKF